MNTKTIKVNENQNLGIPSSESVKTQELSAAPSFTKGPWRVGATSDAAVRAAADEIVPKCLSRTCFMKIHGECWGCDEQKAERERVAAVITKHCAPTHVNSEQAAMQVDAGDHYHDPNGPCSVCGDKG